MSFTSQNHLWLVTKYETAQLYVRRDLRGGASPNNIRSLWKWIKFKGGVFSVCLFSETKTAQACWSHRQILFTVADAKLRTNTSSETDCCCCFTLDAHSSTVRYSQEPKLVGIPPCYCVPELKLVSFDKTMQRNSFFFSFFFNSTDQSFFLYSNSNHPYLQIISDKLNMFARCSSQCWLLSLPWSAERQSAIWDDPALSRL